jgi:hypothetical protein
MTSAPTTGLPLMIPMLLRAYIGGMPSSWPFWMIASAAAGDLMAWGSSPDCTSCPASSIIVLSFEASGRRSCRCASAVVMACPQSRLRCRDLPELQGQQDVTRFDGSLLPPCERGLT